MQEPLLRAKIGYPDHVSSQPASGDVERVIEWVYPYSLLLSALVSILLSGLFYLIHVQFGAPWLDFHDGEPLPVAFQVVLILSLFFAMRYIFAFLERRFVPSFIIKSRANKKMKSAAATVSGEKENVKSASLISDMKSVHDPIRYSLIGIIVLTLFVFVLNVISHHTYVESLFVALLFIIIFVYYWPRIRSRTPRIVGTTLANLSGYFPPSASNKRDESSPH